MPTLTELIKAQLESTLADCCDDDLQAEQARQELESIIKDIERGL